MNTQSQLAQAPTTPAGSFFRYVSAFALKMPALQKPELKEPQVKAQWIHSIAVDSSPTGTNFLRLGTVSREDEKYPISGAEYKRRVESNPMIFLGYQHANLLVENQDEFPEFAAIFNDEKIQEDQDSNTHFYVDFLGFVVLDKDGRHFCPHVSLSHKSRLFLGWSWLERGLHLNGRIAVVDPPIPIVAG